MAPGSAVAATGRLKLLSLASFGLISGACFFIGYYLLRRYRQASHQKTDDSPEEKLTTASVNSPLADEVFAQPEFTKEVAAKTAEENENEEKELKEEEEKVKEKEEDVVKQTTASTQHVSASGTLDSIESDRHGSLNDLPISSDVKNLFLHGDSGATGIVAATETESEQPVETTVENEKRRDKKEATTVKTSSTETGSEPRGIPPPKEVQAGRNEARVSTKEEPGSERRTAVKAAELTVQKSPSSEGAVTKTVEATTDKEPKSEERIGSTKSAELTSENEQKSPTIKSIKAPGVHTEKQSRPEKLLGLKSAESTVQKSTSADRNKTKPAKATSPKETTTETTKHATTTDTFNGATEQQTLKHAKSTDVSTKKEPASKTITDSKVAETASVSEQLLSGRPHAKSPEEDRENKPEFPRSGKSHIPEPIKRLGDDRSDHSQESITNRKAQTKSPIASPTKDEAKPAWSEQPGLKESKHNQSGIVKGLNVDAASFQPHKPYLVDGSAQELTSTARNKDDHKTETKPLADKKIDSSADSVSSSLSHSPGQKVSQTDEHLPESEVPQTLIAQLTKSQVPLPPLTPPPDTNKQSRRQRDRGIRGSQKTTVTPVEPASVENQSRRSGHRWPPLEDKTLDRVEVDTSSQQVSWKTNKSTQPSCSSQSPWSSPSIVQDEPSSGQARRKTEFDDNFVDPVSPQVLHSPNEKSGLVVPSDVTKQSSLLNATPDCVLERKPLISEDDEDEDDADDDAKKQFARKNSTKNGNEDVKTEPAGASNSNEDTAKLVEIDQNCMGSLIELAGEKTDPDVRLASLRALVNLSWTSDKHSEFPPILDQLCANIDSDDASLKLESLKVLVNLSKNPAMVPHLLAAKAPSNILKLLVPELSEEILVSWLTILDDILWTSKELCLTFASLPTEHRAASPETLYTGLYGLKNSRILKSRIFVLSRHKSQQVTYLASRIYSCLTS